MILRLLLLSSLSVVMFSSGTYTGWRAARWLEPVLDAKARTAAVSRKLGGLFDAP